MENKNKSAVQTAKKSAKSFLSALNSKRKRLAFRLTMMMATMSATAATAFADDGGGSGSSEADVAFGKLIGFFALWIGRVGIVVAFVGATMFGFSIKSDDPEGKQRGLTTMVAGFIVFAITKSLNMFGFDVPIL